MVHPSSALLGFLTLSTLALLPCRADDPAGARAAHQELQAALNTGGPALSDADMIGHLKAALKALKSLPPGRADRSGQRRADAYIRAAISEIENGGTPNAIKGDIFDADSVVRSIED